MDWRSIDWNIPPQFVIALAALWAVLEARMSRKAAARAATAASAAKTAADAAHAVAVRGVAVSQANSETLAKVETQTDGLAKEIARISEAKGAAEMAVQMTKEGAAVVKAEKAESHAAGVQEGRDQVNAENGHKS